MARMLIGLLLLAGLAACGTKNDPVQVVPEDTLGAVDTLPGQDTIPGQDTTPGPDTVDTKAHYADIKNLMDTRCANCHSTKLSGAAREGAPTKYNYNTYATCKAGGYKGLSTVQDGSMPPGKKFSSAEKALYKKWVDDGMLE